LISLLINMDGNISFEYYLYPENLLPKFQFN
jgi:hypothetical protein